MSHALKTCRVERVAFVATKADHVPAMRRDNLRNLLRALVETTRKKDLAGRQSPIIPLRRSFQPRTGPRRSRGDQ